MHTRNNIFESVIGTQLNMPENTLNNKTGLGYKPNSRSFNNICHARKKFSPTAFKYNFIIVPLWNQKWMRLWKLQQSEAS